MTLIERAKATRTRPKQVRHDEQRRLIDEANAGFSLSDTFLVNYQDHVDEFVAQSWLPDVSASASWNSAGASQSLWSHDVSSTLMHFDAGHGMGHDTVFYSRPGRQSQDQTTSQHAGSEQDDAAYLNVQDGIYQPRMQSRNEHTEGYEGAYHSQTPQAPQPLQHQHQSINNATLSPQVVVPNLEAAGYPPNYLHRSNCADLYQQGHHPNWAPAFSETNQIDNFVNCFPNLEVQAVPVPHAGLTLDWSASNQPSAPTPVSNLSYPKEVTKRKPPSSGPKAKKIRSAAPDSAKGLSQFVVVFENEPGALATVKRRRKLDAPVRKAAKDVRKAGACHQCRFRKRTCSTGTPCNSCLKNGNGLQEIKCQRESPFVGKLMHQYFEHSSTRRVVSFDVRLSHDSLSDSDLEFVSIDGVGRLSHAIRLPARRKALSSFSNEAQGTIRQTEDSKNGQGDTAASLLLLNDDESLGIQIEQWALEYTSKFVHAAGPEFYSTTIAQILGTAYVKKGLPESALVAAMLRVAALAFILRAGVKYTPASNKPTSRFRTIQARVDTILYLRLQLAEKDLFQMLQHLIFRSAGYLAREQVYPVALVMWQLMRVLCIGASHLSNIVQRFKSKAFGPADYQLIGLKLVLSTHMALFRSSNPLLLNFNDKFNQDLVGGDKQLIKLAMQMRKVVLTFRQKGFPDMKGSIVYRKEYFDMFRRVYDGL